MGALAKTMDEVEFIKSRYGKEITVRFKNSSTFTGVLKRYRGLGTENPHILIETSPVGMIWIDLDPNGSYVDMGRV